MPVKAMEHTIDQNDDNITAANGTASVMSDIYIYKVPRHTAILIRPEDVISAYLKDAGSEAEGSDPWELVVRDPNGLSIETLAKGQYTVIKEFQDSTKLKKLKLSKLVKSDYYIALRVKATTVLVVASCLFQLTCLRYAETL